MVSLTVLAFPYLRTNVHAAAEPDDNAPTSSAVYVSYRLESQHPQERICIGDHTKDDNNNHHHHNNNGNDGSYTCTTRGEQIQSEAQRADPFHWGVDQRIDGSDTEKESIQDVISMMQRYFMDEVLVKPAYKEVRQNWYVRACEPIIKDLHFIFHREERDCRWTVSETRAPRKKK